MAHNPPASNSMIPRSEGGRGGNKGLAWLFLPLGSVTPCGGNHGFVWQSINIGSATEYVALQSPAARSIRQVEQPELRYQHNLGQEAHGTRGHAYLGVASFWKKIAQASLRRCERPGDGYASAMWEAVGLWRSKPGLAVSGGSNQSRGFRNRC